MNTLAKWTSSVLAVLAVLALAAYLGARWYMGVLLPPLDHEPPTLPALQRPAVLVFHKANGFVHKEALPKANEVLAEIAREAGWSIYHTDNGAVMNPEQLQLFNVVVWNNTSGTTLTAGQQQAFRAYLESGGGFVGLHAAGGDPWYQWPWYVETLIGAQFTGHTMNPQFQDADVLVAADTVLTAHLPGRWTVAKEEWYAFDSNPHDKGYEILLRLDESSYAPGGSTMAGEHPIAWRHAIGDGRAVYSAIGHTAMTYDLPKYQSFIEKAIRWAGAIQ